MKYIYRGFMLGIGFAVCHLILGAVMIASVWGTLQPIVEQFIQNMH